MNDEMSKYNDSELAKFIENGETMIDELKDEIRDIQNDVDAFKAEQEARTLAAYWKANPQLTPLTVGDKLLVTAETVAMDDGVNDPVGATNTVSSKLFLYHGELGYMVHLDASWGEVVKNIEVVSSMRRAYLATVNEESHDDR